MVRLAITGRKQAAPAGCSGAPLARKLGVAKHQAPLAGPLPMRRRYQSDGVWRAVRRLSAAR